MKKKRTIIDYSGQIFCVFGVTMAILTVLCSLLGESARETVPVSMFRLGSSGLPLDLILQFFAAIVLITAFGNFCMSEWLTKRLTVFARNMIRIPGVAFIMGAFIIIFDWFPTDMWEAWLGFLVSFAVCFAAGTVITQLKLKKEDIALEAGLSRLREELAKAGREQRVQQE